ncbi:hypothetical protein HNQ80_000193 [Anaerosolibacter carboniphilus]|uniref:Uncharacterized protein n=1 Tax=Anaerosolibacter carboniphilus TaxID=1417629 RepID=A0A841KJS8_9FIRM|nr:hypothetical protein [Anaerosolibacter carboniphilus]MBB6214124.1 hypothetical protein [Anaerosolibacter carboniphilus]
MQKEKLINVVKERWKYYLIGYIVGYIFPLIYSGVPDIRYLFPIKIMSFVFALWIGTSLYYASLKLPVFVTASRSMKYIIAGVILIIIAYLLKEVIYETSGFDITPFIGIPE